MHSIYKYLGLEVEGIYRVSGTKSKVDILKESYDQGTVQYTCPTIEHHSASLPLIPSCFD